MARFLDGDKLLQKILQKKEARFIIVGGFNTVLTYIIYVALIYCGIHHLVSMAVVYVIGIVNGYIWNRVFTFKSREKPAGEFVRYAAVYVAVFFIGLAALYLMVDRAGMNPYAAGAVNVAVITVISWLGHRYYTFKASSTE
ncbi:MAG TPA: GtrA family protein [bacterium]|nr:GtrA family protein [bacterium]